jgi:RNA polymerase sigma-70 factor (ECF subfamily)
MNESLKNIRADANEVMKSWVTLFTHSLYEWAYYKVGDKATAEDLVQETFLSAFQSLDRFKQESQPKTWLFSILNHKIIDHFRKKVKSPLVEDGGGGLDHYFDHHGEWDAMARPQEWMQDEVHLLDHIDFRATLDECMQRLPGSWSAALQLKYLSEKDGKEICQDLQISSSNFWQILHRAKLQLRKCLEIHWFKK